MTESLTVRHAKFVVYHPWRVLLLLLLIVMAAASGGRFIEFTNDYRVFFSEDNPELNAFEAMQDIYTKTDNVLFVIAPKRGDVFNAETLALVSEMTEQSWQTPYSTRVDSITNFQHTVAAADDLLVGDLVPASADLSLEFIDFVRDVALNEPILINRLVSPRAHVTGINVTVQLPGKSLDEVPETANFARALAQEMMLKYPNHEIHSTGLAMMNNAFGEMSQKDMATLVPLMFLTIIVVLGVLLRSFSATFVSIFMIFSTIMFAMGLMGWLGWKLTPASAGAPTILMTMAVADTVHLLVTFLHNMRRGHNKAVAMLNSLRVNFQPIFITSITTAIGFLSMNFSDVPPFQDLGNVVAMGVMFAFVLSVTVLPAMMMLMPIRIKVQEETDSHLMVRFALGVVNRRGPLLLGMGLLAVSIIAFLPQNTLDDQFVEYFDETVEFRQGLIFLVKTFLVFTRCNILWIKEAVAVSVIRPSYNRLNDFQIG